MTNDNLMLDLDIDTEITAEIEDKGPTKKDLKLMEEVYSDILKPTAIDLSGLEDISNEDKLAVLRISRYIEECREANKINSSEYVRVDKDEDIRELDCSEFEYGSGKDIY